MILFWQHWQNQFKPDSYSTSLTLCNMPDPFQTRAELERVWNVTESYFCQVGDLYTT